MRIVQIQFSPWDKIYNFSPNGHNLTIGDKVIVKTELGVEIGAVVGFIEVPEDQIRLVSDEESNCLKENSECGCGNSEECPHKIIKPVLRKANLIDLEKVVSDEEKKKALDYCKKMTEKCQLPMKLVDAHFSFDGSRLTFAFIAEGRVDFRELVKELAKHFNRSIRLQQIGIRDEARVMGDYGSCGRPLCCAKFLKELNSVTSEMAEAQQCAHRGSDRLSGSCGRLKCCLSYEIEGYKEQAKKLPPLGARVNVDGQRGIVVSHHILKQSVSVEFPPEKEGDRSTTVEVDLNRKKT
jgi:cell fate regulator YaaT (PSP1 superfamily)